MTWTIALKGTEYSETAIIDAITDVPEDIEPYVYCKGIIDNMRKEVNAKLPADIEWLPAISEVWYELPYSTLDAMPDSKVEEIENLFWTLYEEAFNKVYC